MKNLSDEKLMMLYKEIADSKAFDELFERYQPKIYGYLKSRITDAALCEDILQTTFLKLHKSRQKYSERYRFAPWLFTICRNSMVDAFRKRNQKEIITDKIEEVPSTNQPVFAKETIPDEAWQQLPPKHREALKLRYFSDKTFDEIAQELQTSAQTVRQWVSRGIKKLRYTLKGDGGDGKK